METAYTIGSATESVRPSSVYQKHLLFWVIYFVYSCVTDVLIYPNFSLLTQVVLMLSHNVFLFYTFLFCLRKFTKKSPTAFLSSIIRFVIVMAAFFVIRFSLKYYVYPVLDKWQGIEPETLVVKEITVGAIFWMVEYFFIACAYFYFTISIERERQLRTTLQINFEQEKALEIRILHEERTRELEKLYEERKMTFVNLVHETKTPLTLINNYISEYIENNGSSAEMDIIKKNVLKLSMDVNNLFDLEKFQKGIQVYDTGSICDVSLLGSETLQLFEPYCAKKQLTLSSFIEPDLFVAADPGAIIRIINNVVENAIKFSNPGDSISFHLLSDEHRVLLKVADNGIGIDENQLPNILTPYFQINHNKKNIQGMGLGLPLVKDIVESLKGEIIVTSSTQTDQSGTVVQISLPRSFGTAQASLINQLDTYFDVVPEIKDYYKADGLATILVVEDNLMLNAYLGKKLSQFYNVLSAVNGRQALEKIQVTIPDLIITDIMMDEMDGFSMAEILSKNDLYSYLPILFLTARTGDNDKIKGLGMGAIDYIEKPFAIDQILLKVNSILKQQSKLENKLYQDAFVTMKQLRKKTFSEAEVNNQKTNLEKMEQLCALTKREMEIVHQLIGGSSARSIGEKLFISEKTVNTHIRNIYEKTGVKSKFELMVKLQGA